MDLKILVQTIKQISEDKKIEAGKILGAVEDAIAAAYRKEYGQKGEVVKAKLDSKTGELKFWQVKEIVDETTVRMSDDEPEKASESELVLPRYNPDRHILISDAKKIKADAKVGEELQFPLETKTDFGRIAAQASKQVIIQKLRGAERESVVAEFKDKEDHIVSGIIQRFEKGNIYVDLGRAIGIMFYNESIPGEHYRAEERLRFYVLAVQSDSKTPGIILSRAHPKFVSKLFEMEVPEIADKSVEIKTITREPGSRTKIAVYSNVEGVDPVGSCVGQRGTRVMAVTNELGQEKIDIIEWSEDQGKFVGNALSPAKVKSVEILPHREALVLVSDDQLSLAIGKGGQNVRLAAKLTGWKIDVRSQARPEEAQTGGIASAAPKEEETVEGEEKEVKSDKKGGKVEETEKPIYHKVEDED